MSSFNVVTDWAPAGPGRWTGAFPEGWGQGRTAFGGAPAAAALRSMQSLAGDRCPRDLSARFVGPIAVDEPAEMTAAVLRAGRSLTHVEARIVQGGTPRVIALASFGVDRPSGISVVAPPRSDAPDPEGLPAMPYIPGVTPAFTQHFDFRWAGANYPFTGSALGEISGWCRHRGDAGPVPPAIIGLMDAWAAPVLPMFKGPAPASTVSLTTHLVAPPEAIDPAGWWWYRSRAITAGAGYATMRADLYRPDGQLAAWTEQLVAVYDQR